MFENIQRVLRRIDQIEERLNPGRHAGAGGFQQALGQAGRDGARSQALAGRPGQLPDGSNAAMWGPARLSPGLEPSNFGPTRPGTLNLQPLAQSNSASCGQTSVAMAINALTGKDLRDTDIDSRYGFELLHALNSESGQAGYRWQDGGEISAASWELIDHKVNQEKTPVIVGLNGPEFSPSGRGHIVTIVKTEGDQVTFADPATGQLRTTTKQAMNNAPSHPDGNFVFYADQRSPDVTPVATR